MLKNHARTPQEFLPKDDKTPRRKRRRGRTFLTIVAVLIPLGAIGLFLLGQPLPEEKAGSVSKSPSASSAPPLAFGDRVERRMDAFIDRVRPKWADPVEEEFEEFVDKVGPKIGRGMENIGIDPTGGNPDKAGKPKEKSPAGEKPPVKAPSAKSDSKE